MSDKITLVLQSWKKRRRNHRVLFGVADRSVRLDWQRSIVAFRPEQIFGYERWDANKYGTQSWTIDILKSARPDQQISRVRGVKPGAVVLASLRGGVKCRAVLNIIDKLESTGDIARLGNTEWRLIGSEIQDGLRPESPFSRLHALL